jgi:hypothetical protein
MEMTAPTTAKNYGQSQAAPVVVATPVPSSSSAPTIAAVPEAQVQPLKEVAVVVDTTVNVNATPPIATSPVSNSIGVSMSNEPLLGTATVGLSDINVSITTIGQDAAPTN